MTAAAQTLRHRPAPPAATFLARHGQAGAAIEPLDADASTRAYYRLAGKGRLLMEDCGDPNSVAAFVQIARHLRGLGLSAPVVHGADASAGLALIEDFGSQTYAKCLDAGVDATMLYTLAIDALLHLHHAPKAAKVARPAFDHEEMLTELRVFTEWFAPEFLQGQALAAFETTFLDLWKDTLGGIPTGPQALVLRDFHVDNLMLLADRKGTARCGLLDFQDALIGPVEYDLVSLLQDARRDLAPGLEDALLDRYFASAPAGFGPVKEMRRRYHLLGAQRHARIAGVFVRLCKRDYKPRYLRFLPRVLHQLRKALISAGLTDLLVCLDGRLTGWSQAGQRLIDIQRRRTNQEGATA